MRRFNTTGPCNPKLHYMLPAERRLPEAMDLIDEGLYFVVHAPRQSGKTTSLLALADAVSAHGDRLAIRVSCENASFAGEDVGAAEDMVLQMIRQEMREHLLPKVWMPPLPWPDAAVGTKLNVALREWAQSCPVPIVLLFDEIDALYGNSLMTVLRQLRDGFHRRPERFPVSVVLCGLRDVRDYKAAAGGDSGRMGGASPFNVAVESMRIDDFTLSEIAELYGQHTADTGQEFTEDAVARVFEWSRGQPWLVNAFAREVTMKMKVPVSESITAADIDEAKDRLIARRSTHIDSLVDKLADPSVRRIVEPLIAGEFPQVDVTYNDAVSYVRDLGIVAATSPLEVANPVYREVISRVLAQPVMDAVMQSPRSFVLADGRVDVDRLLREFVDFWREKGALMARGEGFPEAGVQLVLLGFLYRVMNGGGFADSEYDFGGKRLDILIRKPYVDGDGGRVVQREALEVKVWRDGCADPVEAGLDQLDIYLGHLGVDTGTLVIFDRRADAAPLVERGTFGEETTADGRKVRLLRL